MKIGGRGQWRVERARLTECVESLGGVLTVRAAPGGGSPEIAWGDLFFSYAPDGLLLPRSLSPPSSQRTTRA